MDLTIGICDDCPEQIELFRRYLQRNADGFGLTVIRVRQALKVFSDPPANLTIQVMGFNYDGQRGITVEQKEAIEKSDWILLFTRTIKADDLSPGSSFMPDFAADLVKTADVSGKKLAAVSVRNPYDAQALTNIKSQLAVYSDWDGGGKDHFR